MDEFEAGDGAVVAPRSRVPVLGVVVAAAAVLVALAVVVPAVRPAPAPSPSGAASSAPSGAASSAPSDAASSAPSATASAARGAWAFTTLRPDGIGPVTIGADLARLNQAVCVTACTSSELVRAADDSVGDCEQYVRPVQGDGENLVFAWLRNGAVVAVGVVHHPAGVPVATPVGVTVGQESSDLDANDPPGSVTRRLDDGTAVTAADLDIDGLVDYGAVATPAAAECRGTAGGASLPRTAAPDEVDIEGATAYGITVGMDEATARSQPGWEDVGFSGEPCRPMVHEPGVTAYLRDGAVVGLSAARASGGLYAGQPLLLALDRLDQSTVRVSLRVRYPGEPGAGPSADPWAPSFGRVEGVDLTGRAIVLDVVTPPVQVPGILWPVSRPATAEAAVVSNVTIGESCWEPLR